MKRNILIGTILFLLACNENSKPNLDGFDNYRTFDEYKLEGVGKLDTVQTNMEYVSIRKYSRDSIKVYNHKTARMETYIKKDMYWYSKYVEYDVLPQDEIEDDAKVEIKYVFNDTLVNYVYYVGGGKDLYKKDETASLDIYTKKNEFGVEMKNVELNYSIIHDIIRLLKDNTFKNSSYFVEGWDCIFREKEGGNSFYGFDEVSKKLQESNPSSAKSK